MRAGLRLLEEAKLDTLRHAIAEGDADFAAGRFKTYKAGELTRELRDAIPRSGS